MNCDDRREERDTLTAQLATLSVAAQQRLEDLTEARAQLNRVRQELSTCRGALNKTAIERDGALAKVAMEASRPAALALARLCDRLQVREGESVEQAALRLVTELDHERSKTTGVIVELTAALSSEREMNAALTAELSDQEAIATRVWNGKIAIMAKAATEEASKEFKRELFRLETQIRLLTHERDAALFATRNPNQPVPRDE